MPPPAGEIEELPPRAFVFLPHRQGPHSDRVAGHKLNRAIPIASTRHAGAYLKRKGFTATRALRTWETLPITKGEARLRLTAMPGTHAPGPLAAALPPVMGSMLEFRTRSEEHTSELQSRQYLVCRLLLEKK